MAKKGFFETRLLRSRIKSPGVKLLEAGLGYFIGPFGAMLAGGIFSNFLNKYWTEVLFAGQLDETVQSFLALLPMLSAILIILGNLIAGQIIERTRSKAGKARPWILLSSVTVALASLFLFICPSDDPMVKMILTAISYNLFYAIVSPIYNTANSTLVPVSTRNGKQRSLLASASNMAGIAVMGAGSMVFPILLGLLVTETTSNEAARTYWFILFAIVAVITFIGGLLQFYFTRERVTEESVPQQGKKEHVPAKKQLKAVVSDKFWWLIIIFYLLYQISGGLKNLSMTYFTAKVTDNSFWGAGLDANTAAGMTQTLLGILGAIPMVIAGAIIWPLSNKIGKRITVAAGMLIGVIGGVIAGIWHDNVVLVGVGIALKCLGSAPAGYMILAMISDALDHIEAKAGFRSDGLTMSIYSSIMVASTPIAQGLFNIISQAGQSVDGIVISYIWVETFAYGLCAIIILFFGVEKGLANDHLAIRSRQKEEALSRGEEWIEPEERIRLEEEAAERESEQMRLDDLRAKCEKKGLSFEEEEAKYQAKKKRKK
ncbi:MAG: MFS transporter [Bacilli bacterium]|nr:MFS transporter [Bacilli bacterium]